MLTRAVAAVCTVPSVMANWLSRHLKSSETCPHRVKIHNKSATSRILACPIRVKNAIIAVFFRVRISPFLVEKIMVVIRLSRGGAKKRPFYNIVATDSRNRRDGRFIERIGYYNPVASGAAQPFSIDQQRLTHWQSVGAQLSPTVQRLIKTGGKQAA